MEITEKQKDSFYHNCLRRWTDNILTNRPINREEAKKAIQFAYEVINIPCPKIHFVSSPTQQQFKLKELSHKATNRDRKLAPNGILTVLGDKMRTSEVKEGEQIFHRYFSGQYDVVFTGMMLRAIPETIKAELKREKVYFAEELSQIFLEATRGITYLEDELIECAWLHFAVNVLKINYPVGTVEAYQGLLKSCGLSYYLRDNLVVCDRPKKISREEVLKIDFTD